MSASELYSQKELRDLLGSVGDNLTIDRTVRFFNPRAIHVGSHVRIDAYTILSGGKGIRIGDHVHLAGACQVVAAGGEVVLEDFVGLSARVNVFTATDDYSGGALTNPTVPDEFRDVATGPVRLRRHAIVGCGAVVMQGVTLGLGASVGALTFVNKDVPDFAIVSGNPPRLVGRRNGERLLALEAAFRNAKRG